MRTYATAAAIAWLNPMTILDPACGDASIVETAHKLWPFESASLADISIPNMKYVEGRGWSWAHTQVADLMDTIEFEPPVDLIVLTEILEHVEDPPAVLKAARQRAQMLIASSPIDEPDGGNPEHLWSWHVNEYRQMIVDAGWQPTSLQILSFEQFPYAFQIWTAE